eukprot:UN24249
MIKSSGDSNFSGFDVIKTLQTKLKNMHEGAVSLKDEVFGHKEQVHSLQLEKEKLEETHKHTLEEIEKIKKLFEEKENKYKQEFKELSEEKEEIETKFHETAALSSLRAQEARKLQLEKTVVEKNLEVARQQIVLANTENRANRITDMAFKALKSRKLKSLPEGATKKKTTAYKLI